MSIMLANSAFVVESQSAKSFLTMSRKKVENKWIFNTISYQGAVFGWQVRKPRGSCYMETLAGLAVLLDSCLRRKDGWVGCPSPAIFVASNSTPTTGGTVQETLAYQPLLSLLSRVRVKNDSYEKQAGEITLFNAKISISGINHRILDAKRKMPLFFNRLNTRFGYNLSF